MTIRSWSDTKVVLKLRKGLQGIAQICMKAAASGKTDAYTWFISKSDWVYALRGIPRTGRN